MSLKDARTRILRQFGDGALIRLGDTESVPAPVISTGILSLDMAIRRSPLGGFPLSRMVEIYGQEAVGKSSITMSVIAQAQKMGLNCAIIDAEHALDREHASRLGVQVDDLYVNQPSCGEEGLEITDALVCSNEVAVVVVDSVAALVPKAELEGEMGDNSMALQARLMNKALRKLTGSVSKSKCCLIWVNQLREKVGVFFGNPTVTTGGKGLKFYSSLRLEVSRVGAIKSGDQVIGARTKVKVVKNKIAAPANVAEFDLLFDRGFSREGDLLDLAVQHNIVDKSGAWYSWNGDRLGQGKEKSVDLLAGDKELTGKLETAVREKLSA